MRLQLDDQTTVYLAGAVQDAVGVVARPGAVVVRAGHVIGTADPKSLALDRSQLGRVIDRSKHLILPGLVNAHAHLDLTDIGPRPRPEDASFTDWLEQIRAFRLVAEDAIQSAVKRGAMLSRQAGVAFVADLAHTPTAIRARFCCDLPGVSYLECFGLGAAQAERIGRLETQLKELPIETSTPKSCQRIVLGISPHSPYTAGQKLYDHATGLSLAASYRLCSHVAETPEELQFVRDATGPCRDLLNRLQVWDGTYKPSGVHPVHQLEPVLDRGKWLLAHCNYLGQDEIDVLRGTGTSVVYCPCASDYFGQPQPVGRSIHPYRLLVESDVNVCLGTDSIICQPLQQKQPMGILSQMRFLFRRDGTDPKLLLKMATVNGLRAMQFDELDATLAAGAPARFCSVRFDPNDPTDPLVQVLRREDPAEPVGEWEDEILE